MNHHDPTCSEERCSICHAQACHKVEQAVPTIDYYHAEDIVSGYHHHGFSNYLCCEHFGLVMGKQARVWCGLDEPTNG